LISLSKYICLFFRKMGASVDEIELWTFPSAYDTFQLMSELDETPSQLPGKIVRAGLIILPFGTILLGIASFGIWVWKKDRAEDRNYEHARAMRLEPNTAGWQRHFAVLQEVALGSFGERMRSTASYLESSLSAEMMGYGPLQVQPPSGVDETLSGVSAELTGKRRPREVVLVLLPYGATPNPGSEGETGQTASLLCLAHWMTGEATERTLRYLMLPLEAMEPDQQREMVHQIGVGMRLRNERLMFLLVAGSRPETFVAQMEGWLDLAAKGTEITSLPLPEEASDWVSQSEALRSRLFELAGEP